MNIWPPYKSACTCLTSFLSGVSYSTNIRICDLCGVGWAAEAHGWAAPRCCCSRSAVCNEKAASRNLATVYRGKYIYSFEAASSQIINKPCLADDEESTRRCKSNPSYHHLHETTVSINGFMTILSSFRTDTDGGIGAAVSGGARRGSLLARPQCSHERCMPFLEEHGGQVIKTPAQPKSASWHMGDPAPSSCIVREGVKAAEGTPTSGKVILLAWVARGVEVGIIQYLLVIILHTGIYAAYVRPGVAGRGEVACAFEGRRQARGGGVPTSSRSHGRGPMWSRPFAGLAAWRYLWLLVLAVFMLYGIQRADAVCPNSCR